MTETAMLFEPIRIRGLELKNRIVAAPMHMYQGVSGYVTDFHMMHLPRFGLGGAGLVFQESTKIDPCGCTTVGDLGIWKDDFVAPLSQLVDAIHLAGSAAGIQLGHGGRKARCQKPWEGRRQLAEMPNIETGETWDLVAPSAVPHAPGYHLPRELSASDIEAIIVQWSLAAARAARAGYDVLELHAAHGYLIAQFLSPSANLRNDEWGGDFGRRTRLLLRVVEAVRDVWPEDRPLFVRISGIDGDEWTIEDSVRLAPMLADRGVDVVDCSSGGVSRDVFLPTPGYQVPIAEAVRNRGGIPTMAVGMITDPHHAEQILRDGKADLIAVGRGLLENPNWAVKARIALCSHDRFADMLPNYGFWLTKREEYLRRH